MTVHLVEHDLTVGDDCLIDFVLVQWHTTLPEVVGQPFPRPDVDRKVALLNRLHEFLLEQDNQRRPLFILIPELSTPTKCCDQIDRLVEELGVKRAIVVIAGLHYLTWDEYCEIVARWDMPDKDVWTAGEVDKPWVNCAGIWIAVPEAKVTRYVQPKRHPYKDEQTYLHKCTNLLFFKSRNQSGNQHVNFTVHICSDFVSREKVLAFRTECATGSNISVPLDFSFLLQYNSGHDTPYSKQAIQAYFDGGRDMIETKKGTLAIVNNANASHNGVDSWGHSQLCVTYRERWRPPEPIPTPTYRLHDEGGYNYQAVICREDGPCVYHLSYKPISLVIPTPGGGDDLPFERLHATGALIEPSDGPLSFCPLPAIRRWLSREWIKGRMELCSIHDRNQHETADTSESKKWNLAMADIKQEHLKSYDTCCQEWNAYMDYDVSALQRVKTYFLCWDGKSSPCWKNEKPGLDYERNPFTTPEPYTWSPGVVKGIHFLPRIHSLLAMVSSALSGSGLPLDRTQGSPYHIRCMNEIRLAFIWGGTTFKIEHMIQRFLSEIESTRHVPDPGEQPVIVLIEPMDYMDSTKIAEQVRLQSNNFCREQINGVDKHLEEPGEVVSARIRNTLKAILSKDLESALCQSKDVETLKQGLDIQLRGV